MRFLTFLLSAALLVFYSCGNSSASQSTSPNYTPAAANLSGSHIIPYNRIAQTPNSEAERNNLDVTLEINGMPSGTFFLMGIITDQYFLVDSTSQKNGIVRFSKSDPIAPGLYYALYPDRSTAIQMIIDTDQQFKLSTVDGDIVGSMKVEGSLDNELFYEALRYEDQLQPEFNRIGRSFEGLQIGSAEHDALIAEHKALSDQKMEYLASLFKKAPTSLFTSFKEAGQTPNITYHFDPNGSLSTEYLVKLRSNYWTNTNFEDERLLRTPVISNKLKRYYGNIMPQQPDSLKRYTDLLVQQVPPNSEYYKYFVNWVTLEYEPTKTTLMDAEAVFVHMIQNYFTKEKAFWQDSVETYGLQMRAYEMGNSLVGQKGPDVIAKGVDGKTYSIGDIKSDYVIVYMWNPDCEHCAEQTPKLVNLYSQLKNQGVEVFSIAVNTEDDKWRNAVAKYGMPWINVFDPTNKAIYAKYYVDNTPELYILNPDRTIIGKNLKVNQVTTIIDRDKERRG
jgi:peroxiredoxin